MPDRQMASIVATLTTVDVYELASGIGNQFEKMIDTLGTESITGLMPMVIRALEYLEELTQRSENENAEICDLKFTVERLQAEKKLKAEEKLKFEKELEQIEDSWKMEAHAHREMITKLQDENHRLNSIIQQHKIKEINNIELIDEYNGLQEEIERLKVIISKQREELKSLDKSLDQQTTNAEMLETRVKQLCKQNSESHKKSHQMEKVAQNMIFEKSNIQSQLNDRDRQIAFLLEKVKRLETFSRDDISIEEQKRFFGHQEIVKQRDEMRTKVQALEEELVLLKYSNREMEVEASKNYGNDDDHDPDAPVQGPINREPDEKLYPDKFKRQSGIKKFFKNLLSPTKNMPGRMIPLRDPLQNSNSASSGAIYRRSSLHSSSLSLLSSQKCHPF